MSSKVRDTDKGYAALRKRLAARLSLTVGIHDEEGSAEYQDGVTVAEVGEIHEFGLGHCPRRSFLVDWADENDGAIRNRLVESGKRVVLGADPRRELERAGALFVGQIQRRIARRIPPPLAEVTIRRKGSDVPLIDKGQLRASITWKVEER